MKNIKQQKGQALISLLFFVVMATAIISAATAIIITNLLSTTITAQSQMAYYYAESGVEDALLRILRNPTYTATTPYQALLPGEGSAMITVVGGKITSVGISSQTARKIVVQTLYTNGKLTISSWEEQN